MQLQEICLSVLDDAEHEDTAGPHVPGHPLAQIGFRLHVKPSRRLWLHWSTYKFVQDAHMVIGVCRKQTRRCQAGCRAWAPAPPPTARPSAGAVAAPASAAATSGATTTAAAVVVAATVAVAMAVAAGAAHVNPFLPPPARSRALDSAD